MTVCAIGSDAGIEVLLGGIGVDLVEDRATEPALLQDVEGGLRHGQRGQSAVGHQQGPPDVGIGAGGGQLRNAACAEADGGGVGPVGGECHGVTFALEGGPAQWTRIVRPLASPLGGPPRCRRLPRPLVSRGSGRPTLAYRAENRDDRPRLLEAAVPPSLGPRSVLGPVPRVLLRVELDVSRDRMSRCAILYRSVASLREAGWIALSSPRPGRASCVRAPTARCLAAPPPVAGLHSMAPFSDAAESACIGRPRLIPNSHAWHKDCLCRDSIPPRGRCNGHVGAGCDVFPAVTPRSASVPRRLAVRRVAARAGRTQNGTGRLRALQRERRAFHGR